jgi:hypothetical protein
MLCYGYNAVQSIPSTNVSGTFRSIFKVEDYAKQETSMKQPCFVSASFLTYSSTLKMEAIYSYELR